MNIEDQPQPNHYTVSIENMANPQSLATDVSGHIVTGAGGSTIVTGNLYSNNYKADTSGWHIESNGKVEFFNADFFVGNPDGEYIFFAESSGLFYIAGTVLIYGEKILFYDDTETQRGSITSASTGAGIFFISGQGGAQLRLQAGSGQDIVVVDNVIPFATNTYDLGSATLEYKDGFFDGTVQTDALRIDQAPTTGLTADQSVGHACTCKFAINLNGTSYDIPCEPTP